MKFVLPDLPATWSSTRLDHVATVRARIGWKALKASEYVPDGYAFLSTPNIKGGEIDFENVNYIDGFRFAESPELKLQKGDVLLVKDGNTLGITNIVGNLPRPATVNGSIAVIRSDILEPRFLRYVLASNLVQDMIAAVKAGMGVPHLFQADIKKFPLPRPPGPVQRAIADYLDRETSRIDVISTAKKRMVTLLELRRGGVIDAALGDAYAQRGEGDLRWTVRPLKTILAAPPCYGVLKPAHYDGTDGVPLLRIMDLDDGKVDRNSLMTISPAQSYEYRRTQLRSGDIAVSVVGTIGKAATVGPSLHGANMSRALARLQLVSGVHSRYVTLWCSTSGFRRRCDEVCNVTAQPVLNMGDLREFSIALPLDCETDEVILALDRKLEAIDKMHAIVERQYALLQEHRQALITAAVTGQLDILEAE